jgi:hypothetical protein
MSGWFATGLSPAFGDQRVYPMDTVSRPIRLSEGAAPIRRVLIFDDHPATARLLGDVDPALKHKNKPALRNAAHSLFC